MITITFMNRVGTEISKNVFSENIQAEIKEMGRYRFNPVAIECDNIAADIIVGNDTVNIVKDFTEVISSNADLVQAVKDAAMILLGE